GGEFEADGVGGALEAAVQGAAQLVVLQADAVHGVERAQNVLVGAQAESAQEDGAQELALPVNADVENILLVVFELHPGPAIRNDLAQEVSPVVGALKEHSRRAVQLA